jgi:hypothetical protein
VAWGLQYRKPRYTTMYSENWLTLTHDSVSPPLSRGGMPIMLFETISARNKLLNYAIHQYS